MQRRTNTTSKPRGTIAVKDLEDIVESIQLGLKQVTECVAQLDTIRQDRVEQIKEEEAAANKLSDGLIAKIDLLYSSMDVDGDERLSKREAREFFKQFGNLEVSIFEEADEDHDGAISPAEWREFWQQLANNGYSQEGIAKELEDFDRIRKRHSEDWHVSRLPTFGSSCCKTSMRRVVRLKMQRVHDAWTEDDDDQTALESFGRMLHRGAKITRVQKGRRSLLSILGDGIGGEPKGKKVVIVEGGQENAAQNDEGSGDDAMKPGACTTMHPNSKLRLTWDFLSTLMVLWDLIWLPVSLLISDVIVSADFDWYLSLFTACFWSADVLASCCTGYDAGTRIERDPRAVLKYYLRTWLVLDLSVVSVEWVSVILEQTAAAGGALRSSRTFRILRFSRVIRIFRLIKIRKYLNKIDAVNNSMRLQVVMGVFKLSVVLFFLVHLLACGWFAVGETDPSDGWVVGGLDNEGAAYQDEDTVTKYIASFRWTLAQVNGRTDLKKRNLQEMVYTSLCAVFAIMFMSYFVGSMTTRLMEFQNLLSQERGYLRVLHTYAEVHELSWSTVHLCKRYIKDHLRFSQEIDAEKHLLDLLPHQTVNDLLNEVRLAPVCRHQLFCFMVHVHDSGFNAAVRDILSYAAFSDAARCMEIVFAKGSVGDRMLFVESGSLMYSRNHSYTNWMTTQFLEHEEKQDQISMDCLKSVCGFLSRRKDDLKDVLKGPDHSTMRRVGPGDYLCEPTLWTKTWSTRADLLSVTHCKLVSLRCDKFIEIVKTHGEDVLTCLSFYARCYNTQLRRLIEQEIESDLVEVNLKALLGLGSAHAATSTQSAEVDTEGEEEDYEQMDPFALLQSRDSEIELGQEPGDAGKGLSSIVPGAEVGERTANGNGNDYKASL